MVLSAGKVLKNLPAVYFVLVEKQQNITTKSYWVHFQFIWGNYGGSFRVIQQTFLLFGHFHLLELFEIFNDFHQKQLKQKWTGSVFIIVPPGH